MKGNRREPMALSVLIHCPKCGFVGRQPYTLEDAGRDLKELHRLCGAAQDAFRRSNRMLPKDSEA